MGIYDQLMDPAYDSEVALLMTLSQKKRDATPWLTFGRALGEVPNLVINGSSLSKQKRVRALHAWREGSLEYSPVLSAVW
jgi:hypothetical protein